MTTGTISEIEVGGVSTGQRMMIDTRDVPVCVVGLELLASACKRTRNALMEIALDPDLVAEREDQCLTLLEAFKSDDPAIGLGVPVTHLDTLRTGLSIEYDKTAKAKKAQEELLIPADESSTRLKQLNRIIAALDMARLGGETVES